jgi:hypothetical protein
LLLARCTVVYRSRGAHQPHSHGWQISKCNSKRDRSDERFCRGDGGASKSDASNATIGINECGYLRVQRLKLLTVNGRAGNAIRRYQVVKADGAEDLVFQSVNQGAPTRDNNILNRAHQACGQEGGAGFCERAVPPHFACDLAHATWRKMAAADVKDAQAQMRIEHHAGYLPAVRPWVAAKSGRKTQQPIETRAENGWNWIHNGRKCGKARG